MENHLASLEEFQNILASYKISAKIQEILGNTKLVLMLAPSSSGRNTIITELLKSGKYHFIVSDTTRYKRSNNGLMEQNGVEYWFKSEAEFLIDLKKGEYLEAEIIHNQQVSGISFRELQRARAENKIAITDIDLMGMENVVAVYPQTIPLLVLPPDFKEWQVRLNNRGEMQPQEVRRRLKTAINILEAGLEHDYFIYVVNDDFHQSVKLINDIVENGANKLGQKYGQKVNQQLLTDTKQFLKI